jgi:SAM-dependent methyltransferase
MTTDASFGWNAVAERFIAARTDIGAATVRQWAQRLAPGAAVLDLGCGSGHPISAVLVEHGLQVFGVDASPTLAAAFRRRFPAVPVACEPAETSALFGRTFDAAVAIGLLFLLPPQDQLRLIARVGRALEPGGQFLFTAPRQACEWADSLTGRRSVSLGEAAYLEALKGADLHLDGSSIDEGGNNYFYAVRPPS